MALTVRGESSTASNTAALSLTTPAGTQVGDLLVLIHCDDFYTAAGLTTPTGAAATTWTLQHTYDGGTDANHAKVWTAPATSAGANSVTPNSSNTDQERYAQLVVIAGAAFDQVNSTAVTTSASWVSPSLTATGVDDILISTAWAGTASTNFTMAGTMTATTEQDLAGGTGTGRSAYEQLSASGSTGTRTHTSFDARTGVVVSVVIQASGGAVTPNPRKPIIASTTLPPRPLMAGRVVQVNSVRFSNAADAAARQIPRSPVTVTTAQPARQRLVGGTVTPQRIPVPQVAYQGGTSGLGLAGTGSQVGSVLRTSLVVVDTAQPARQRLVGGTTVPSRPVQQPVVVGTPEIGAATLGLASTAVQAKTAVEVGNGPVALAATGTAAKVVACGGRSALALAGTGVTKRVAPQAGSSALGAAATGVEKKVAPQAGPSAVGLSATGVAARKQAQAGSSTIGLAARHSGVVARALLGSGAVGLATSGVEKKVAVVTGVCTLGGAGRSSGLTKTAAPAGVAALGAAGRSTLTKTAAGRGAAALSLSGAGADARVAVVVGSSALGLSADSNTVFVLDFFPTAGTITDLAERIQIAAPTDVAGRDRAGTPIDAATRYRAGAPT